MVLTSPPMLSCAIKQNMHHKQDLEGVREEAVHEESHIPAFHKLRQSLYDHYILGIADHFAYLSGYHDLCICRCVSLEGIRF